MKVKLKTCSKRFVALLLALIMTSSLAITANAASFSVPTIPMDTDDNVVKAVAVRAGQIAPLILGCDLVGSSNFGASENNYNNVASILGVFGSDINSNPDPYLYNFNYNFYALSSGQSVVENAAIAEESFEGKSPTTEVIGRILTHRPDLALTQAAGTGNNNAARNTYSDVISELPENTDENTDNDYEPYYYSCSISTLVYQCENLINLANLVNQICDEKELNTRYVDPYAIAVDYDKFVWGYYFYVMSQLETQSIAKKKVAVISKTEDGGANWTLPAIGTFVDQTKPNRLVEYVRDNTDTLNETSETIKSLDDILACDVVIANNNGGVLRSAANGAGKTEDELPLIIDTLPQCLYGMIMQTHENALGIPYIQSIIYADELELNPAYAAAYFYQNFFHITDDEALQETVNTLLQYASLPDSITTDISAYDPDDIEDIILEGIYYAKANSLCRHDDTNPWDPNMSIGIGGAEPEMNNKHVKEPQPRPHIPISNDSPVVNAPSEGTSSKDEQKPEDTEKKDETKDEAKEEKPVGEPIVFNDVAPTEWYAPAVDYVTSRGLMNGVSETDFAPKASVTRGMAITVLYRLAGSPAVTGTNPFSDVNEDWFKDAVQWAFDNGVTTGVSETSFDPNGEISREQLVTLFYRFEKLMGNDVSASAELGSYTDAENLDSWTVDAIKWAVGAGVISGESDSVLNPLGVCNRAALATILMNLGK